MKIINIEINNLISIKNVEDVDTGKIRSINSTLKIPTGNYQNILLNFEFISPKVEEGIKLVASFEINKNETIDVEITNINVNDKDYQTACYIPPEVFMNPCKVLFGVYGFSLNDDETLKQRFSLIPISEIVVKGSYDPDAKESITPSPTIFEIYFNKIDKAKSDFDLWVLKKEKEINESIIKKISYLHKYENFLVTTESTTSIPIELGIEYRDLDIVQVKINGLDFIMNKDFTISNNEIHFVNPVETGNIIYYSIERYITTNPTDYESLRGPTGKDGFSPSISIKENTDSEYILSIANIEGVFDTPSLIGPKGEKGEKGDIGPIGPQGLPGQNGKDGLGVPTGGTTGQVLAKKSNTDNDTEWVDQTGGTGGGDSIPVGTIVEYSGNELPTGYLSCDGQEVSRSEYSSLFDVIGTTYGSGDGSTTFNLPNLKGKVAVGIDENDTDFDELAKSGGEKKHTLTITEMPSHTHSSNNAIVTGKAELQGLSGGAAWTDTGGVGRGLVTSSSGSNASHNNLQPYIVLKYIIKAKKTITLESGKVVDTLEGDSVEDAPSVRAVNDKFESEILWTNPNPSSVFNSQEITLNDGSYKIRKIVFKAFETADFVGTQEIAKGYDGRLFYSNSSGVNVIRNVTCVSDKIYRFENASTDNKTLVPLYIIGYNQENYNGETPEYEKKEDIVKLAEFTSSSYTTKTVENLNNFKLLIWQCCYKGQEYRVLGSTMGTSEQLQKCVNSGLTWQTTFAGDPNNYLCELYYNNDTSLVGKIIGRYAAGVLYGVRK